MENGASWLGRRVNILESFKDIHLLNQIAPFFMYIPKNIPGNIPQVNLSYIHFVFVINSLYKQ